MHVCVRAPASPPLLAVGGAPQHALFQVKDVLPEPADPDQHFLRALGQLPYKPTKQTGQLEVPRDSKKSGSKGQHTRPSPPPMAMHVAAQPTRMVSPTDPNAEVDVDGESSHHSPAGMS